MVEIAGKEKDSLNRPFDRIFSTISIKLLFRYVSHANYAKVCYMRRIEMYMDESILYRCVDLIYHYFSHIPLKTEKDSFLKLTSLKDNSSFETL